MYFGGGSDCLNILDHCNGQRRTPTLQDVLQAVQVQDRLPQIDFVMSMVLPADVDLWIYDRFQMEVMLNHTSKPIVFVSPDFEGCVSAVKMCEIVVGGIDAFQRRPFATAGRMATMNAGILLGVVLAQLVRIETPSNPSWSGAGPCMPLVAARTADGGQTQVSAPTWHAEP